MPSVIKHVARFYTEAISIKSTALAQSHLLGLGGEPNIAHTHRRATKKGHYRNLYPRDVRGARGPRKYPPSFYVRLLKNSGYGRADPAFTFGPNKKKWVSYWPVYLRPPGPNRFRPFCLELDLPKTDLACSVAHTSQNTGSVFDGCALKLSTMGEGSPAEPPGA